MIFTLLLGAFATSASATLCKLDESSAACTKFALDADFEVTSVGTANDVKFAYRILTNAAYTTQTDEPFDPTKLLIQDQVSNGCYQTATPSAVTHNPLPATGSPVTCTSSQTTACSSSGNGEAAVTMQLSLANLVTSLNVAGDYEIYFHRVVANPISNSAGDLQWIATQACKVDVAVEFECTGASCVEVKTIVCASFAGITSGNEAKMNIECKVPGTFPIDGNCDGTGSQTENFDDALNLNSAHWSGAATTPATNTNTGGQVKYERTGNVIAANGNFQGSITLRGCMGSTTESITLTANAITVHVAAYNLTRASRSITGLNMPVQVSFYTDSQATGHWVAPTATTPSPANDLSTRFTTPAGAPFLAKQQVQLGQLTRNIDGFFRIIAKVSTTTHWFKDHQVFNILKAPAQFGGGSPHASCSAAQATPTQAEFTANPTVYKSGSFPMTYIKCPELMGTTAGATLVTAGDTLVASLKWKIAKLTSTTGKAQLLQDSPNPDPAAQSVEVQLTIQLGGGETTITTGAGAGEGSADNTVTYIIIAVCVIAAALILAVVVVAFMCMKNRANEQLVAMSPQKCTVAAVYDISAPKKADAMDV